MAELSTVEIKWFKKLQKVLDECPFDTSDIDSYTIGDNDIIVFKNKHEVAEHQLVNETDLCVSVQDLNAEVFKLIFPFGVTSAAG